jgi:hypothetical protein
MALTLAREWRMVVTDEFQNPLFVLQISAERPSKPRLTWMSACKSSARVSVFL